jgi:CelD/BcsL family acetyltransferase involved in cellulose biosynthesis
MAVKASTDQAQLERAAAIASARRAALADRYAVNSLAVEWRELAELEPIADEWRELAARALEPNIFYEPAFALAAASVFGRGAGAALVWSGTSPRKLLGFFPGRIEKRRYGIRLPVLVGWTHAYAPLGTPLVEREAAEPVITAWLAHLAADPALPGLLLLPFLPEDGSFAAALGTILRRTGMPSADFNRHHRALFAPYGDRALYLERALGSRRQKELRRIGRRLTDLGAVLFTAATEPDAVAAAVEDYLALEASGWKGKAGTAAAAHDDIRSFMTKALCGLSATGQVVVNRLLVDGYAIAATIRLRSGDAAWFWKIAYDETFARYSPGVMLTVAVTEQLVDDATIAQADSCATADHPMIDHIWRQRLAFCDRLVAVRPQAAFWLARRSESLRCAAIAAARRWRARLRRRSVPAVTAIGRGFQSRPMCD